MDRTVFEGLVKDTVANLYDYAALESHPLLFSLMKPPEGFSGSQSQYIRQIFLEAIEQLRPDGREIQPSLPEWRPYLILHQRYVKGMSPSDLAAHLSISDRQLRRDHHRALSALTSILYARLYEGQTAEIEPVDEAGLLSYDVHIESVPLQETIHDILKILRRRLESEGIALDLHLPQQPVNVPADRIILRQILISMLNSALHFAGKPELRAEAHLSANNVIFSVRCPLDPSTAAAPEENALSFVRHWAGQISAQFSRDIVPGEVPAIELALTMPRGGQPTILVIDDQEPAINLFRRFLSRSGYKIVGATRAGHAVEQARELQPVLITLDVMMPQMDGWEVLQALKLDDETRDIPVIICSAWQEPELARSLGAAGFLKKPVTQKDLLEALQRLGLA